MLSLAIEQKFFSGDGGYAETMRQRHRPPRCPVCGWPRPKYRVEAPDRTPLGCEQCLIIRREGKIQL